MNYTDEEKEGIAHLNDLRADPIFEKLFQSYVSRRRFREPEVEIALYHLSYFVADDLYTGQMLDTTIRPGDRDALFQSYEKGDPLEATVKHRLTALGVLLADGRVNPYCKGYIEQRLKLRDVLNSMPFEIAEEVLESMVFSELANEAARSNDEDY